MKRWQRDHGENTVACDGILKKYGIARPRCGFDLVLGWMPIVDRALGDMFAVGWDGRLEQVKQKFGGLRIYVGPIEDERVREAVHARIAAAEREADVACERCGRPHGLRVPLSGRALCPDCKGLRDDDEVD